MMGCGIALPIKKPINGKGCYINIAKHLRMTVHWDMGK